MGLYSLGITFKNFRWGKAVISCTCKKQVCLKNKSLSYYFLSLFSSKLHSDSEGKQVEWLLSVWTLKYNLKRILEKRWIINVQFLVHQGCYFQTDISFKNIKWSIASEMFRMLLEEKINKPKLVFILYKSCDYDNTPELMTSVYFFFL